MILGKRTAGGDLSIDLDRLIENRLLIQGASNSGKSYAVRRLLEQTHGRAQQIVLDVEDEYPSLRERFEYVLGGPGRDFPVEVRSAGLLARRLLELGVSAILNLYELRAHDRIAFVKAFLDSLMSAPQRIQHDALVVVEEAATLAPQSGREAVSTQSVIDLAARGRKRGFAIVAVTQRISDLHKSVVAQCGNRLIGRTTLDSDVKRAVYELGFSGREQARELVELPRGDFFAFGPALSDQVVRVRIGGCETHHGTKRGARAAAPPPAPEKVRAVLSKLADLPAEAAQEARTNEELRAKLRELERDMAAAVKAQILPDPQALERAHDAGREEGRALAIGAVMHATARSERAARAIDQALGQLKVAADALREPLDVPEVISGAAESRGSAAAFRAPRPLVVSPSHSRTENDKSVDGLDGPMQRVLDALAWLEAAGLREPFSREQVAFLASYKPGTGAFQNALGRLRSADLISYPSGGTVAPTDAGRAAAHTPDTPTSAGEIQRRVLDRIDGPMQRCLTPLLLSYPRALTREQLADAAEYQVGTGAFQNALGRLRTLGCIDYPDRGHAVALGWLFLEGA
jgi:hypothetical protein